MKPLGETSRSCRHAPACRDGLPREVPRHGTPAQERRRTAAEAADAGAPSRRPTQDETEEHQQLPTRVRLRPEVVQAAESRRRPRRWTASPSTVDLTGEIAADPDKSARLAARVAGRVVEVKVQGG